MAWSAAASGWVPGSAEADLHWLAAAIELASHCPPSHAAYSVGAVVVAATGEPVATGFSRELDAIDHAEEVALSRVRQAAQAVDLTTATLYSSLEPCRTRVSRPRSCAELIVVAGLRRVVLAWREPALFVPGGGAAWLAEHGVSVVEYPGLAAAAKEPNQHLLGR